MPMYKAHKFVLLPVLVGLVNDHDYEKARFYTQNINEVLLSFSQCFLFLLVLTRQETKSCVNFQSKLTSTKPPTALKADQILCPSSLLSSFKLR